MSTIRTVAVLTLVLLAAYYGLRVLATECRGPQCDTYFIAPSLLLPLLILVVAAVTGVLAIAAARQGARGAWVGILSACTLSGVLGPVGSLAILRDSPDQLVLVATLLVLLVPLSNFEGVSQPGKSGRMLLSADGSREQETSHDTYCWP